jgi:hypothetical protein
MRMGLLASLLAAACAGDSGVVVYNAPPNAAILAPTEGSSFDEGTSVTLEGRVGDDDDLLALTIQWSSDKDGVLSESSTPDPDGRVEYTTANLTPGNHAITLRVVDAKGEQGAGTVSLSIIDLPEPPEVNLTSPTQGEEGVEGQPFPFEAVVSDAQDAPTAIDVVFLSDRDGFLCSVLADAVGKATCEKVVSVGTHLITAEASDSDNNLERATAYLKIIALADIDQDEDGWTPNQGDCNDRNEAVHPTADEQPNEIDDDCDGTIDEGTINYDDDGDGLAERDGDCDDTNRLTYKGAPEVEDGEDNDCDSVIDEGTRVFDDDGDGYSEVAGDCNDSNPAISPAAAEVCDSIDNDCDTLADEENASGCSTFYADRDTDTYGAASDKKCLCAARSPHTATNASDCYDGNASAKPGTTGFFSVHRGDLSFDYNCDGTQERVQANTYSCGSWPGCGLSRAGWSGSVPACGSGGSLATGCSIDWFSCTASTAPSTQTCR